MNRILDLLAEFNSTEFEPGGSEQLLDEMTSMYREAIKRELFTTQREEPKHIRISSLGQPDVCTAWEFFHDVYFGTMPYSLKSKLTGGHLFELTVYYYLKRLGYEVVCQPEVTFEGVATGHPDFVVKDPETGEIFVVECKNCADSIFRSYRDKGMSNQKYLTQLKMYCHSLKVSGLWVIGNADTGEMHGIIQRLDRVSREWVMSRMSFVMNVQKSSNFWETLQFCKPPAPKARKDGTYYIPPEMYSGKGMLHPACALYDYEERVDGSYNVKGYNYPMEAITWQPSL